MDDSDTEFLAELQSRPEVHNFIGALVGPAPRGEDHIFTVMSGETRVGIVGVVKSGALQGQDVELICAISRSAEGNGFATEACKAVMSWAAERRTWARLLACVSDGNAESRALVTRLGFQMLTRRLMRDEDVFAFPLAGAA